MYAMEGRFTFTSHTAGEHVICIHSNSTAWFSAGQLVSLCSTHLFKKKYYYNYIFNLYLLPPSCFLQSFLVITFLSECLYILIIIHQFAHSWYQSIFWFLLIIPAKARDYVFTGVGLSVCLFVTTITK